MRQNKPNVLQPIRPIEIASIMPKPSSGSSSNPPANRPAGREKRYVTGGGNAYRRGEGLGSGPVGFSSGGSPTIVHPNFGNTYTAPSSAASSGAPATYGGASASSRKPTDFNLIETRLMELLQRRAEQEAARDEKQTALDQAQRNADTLQRNLIQQREQARVKTTLAKMQAELAKREAQRRTPATAYDFLPVRQPRLSVPNKNESWTERANIRNLSENMKDLTGVISLLPAGFPIDEFDNMTPKRQLAAVQRTNLSREEQWALLNARTNVKALSEVMHIQENRLSYGLSQVQADGLCQQLLEIDNARIGTKNHALPLATERQRQAFLKILDEKEERLLEPIRYGQANDFRYNDNGEGFAQATDAPGLESGWMERYAYIREHYQYEPNPRALVNDRSYQKTLKDCENAEALTNFQKTFIAKARAGIPIDQVPEAAKLLVNGGTFTVGAVVQAGAGAGISGSLGYTIDANGQDLQSSFSVGASSPDLSAGVFYMYTDAPDAETVRRARIVSTGGAIGPFGMDYVTVIDEATGKVYSGMTYTTSVGTRFLQVPPLNYHSFVGIKID